MSARLSFGVGRVIGVLTLTPYDLWRRTHAIHHATSGNLDRRGIGDVKTLTVREYCARSGWGRLAYRLYRHPLVMFGAGPAYLFFLQHRLPAGLMRGGWRPWASTMATNLAIALIAATLVWLIGIKAFLLVHLPIALLAATIGVWLFYVQHQFEHTIWEPDAQWNLSLGTQCRPSPLQSRLGQLSRRALRTREHARPSNTMTVLLSGSKPGIGADSGWNSTRCGLFLNS